jgi:hypothetical protein
MGNTQSAEAPRRATRAPTKLTKPRTNTSTSNLLNTAASRRGSRSAVDLPAPPNKRLSTVTVNAVVLDDEAEVKTKAAKRPRRWTLGRSKSARPESMVRTEEPMSDIDVTMIRHSFDRYTALAPMKVDMPVVELPPDNRYITTDV